MCWFPDTYVRKSTYTVIKVIRQQKNVYLFASDYDYDYDYDYDHDHNHDHDHDHDYDYDYVECRLWPAILRFQTPDLKS